MILFNAQHVFCNDKEDPFMYVNGKQVWPLDFDTYTIKFEYTDQEGQPVEDIISINGMGWGDEIGYIHSENVIWANYETQGYTHSLTNTEIINSCEDNGDAFEQYCNSVQFNIRGSDVGRFYEFTYNTGPASWPAQYTLKVSIIGYTSEPVVLASKIVSIAPNTTNHVHIGEFS